MSADDWQWSAFDDVDRTAAAMDLLRYCEVWRTPDGTEKMPPLSMQQAQAAVDTVLVFVTDSMRKESGRCARRTRETATDNAEESR